MVDTGQKQIPWPKKLVFELWKLQPKNSSEYGNRGDSGAFAQLRNSIRGGVFEVSAYPYIIPHLPVSSRSRKSLYIEEALIIAQVYSMFPPSVGPARNTDQTEIEGKYGSSIGAKLHQLELEEKMHADPSGNDKISSTERLLKTIISTEMDFLGRRLRGIVQRISKTTTPMSFKDYEALAMDIAFWTNEDNSVQKRWVSDFYRG